MSGDDSRPRNTSRRVVESDAKKDHPQRFKVASLTLPLPEKIPWPYNRPFPFHRLVLRSAQRNFPFGAAVVVIRSDGVGNLKVAVDCAIEAGIAGMAKLRRWEFAN